MKRTDYRSTCHSVSLLYAHLVFVTKYRRRVLDPAMLTDCETTLRQVCTALGAELVEFNGEADHVHLLVRYPPQVPISELVRSLKGATARRLRADYTGRCNRARMHGHFWTPSYFAVSVSAGGAPLSVLKQYIENQERPA
ncbi:IS200/IS605 family transposase [Actinopolymorpha alba]|uniref:IS200/IS605 family transposase n=1 Tax=Actinopolymorpha alba TaxID=533267 RepID=UPI00037FCBEB|nr:IS200/IS605 family transposase [Actinopolymorpha alba]